MKQIYSYDGYKVFRTKILGYVCDVHQTVGSGCLVYVPMGKNKKDKAMFDNLVYNHKGEYWGKTKEEAVRKVRIFIKGYKLS